MDWKQLIAVAVALSCLAATAAAEDGALAYSPSTDEVSSGSSAFFSLRELQIKTLEGCSAEDCRIVATFRAGQAPSPAATRASASARAARRRRLSPRRWRTAPTAGRIELPCRRAALRERVTYRAPKKDHHRDAEKEGGNADERR
jgi:hypothetical protein